MIRDINVTSIMPGDVLYNDWLKELQFVISVEPKLDRGSVSLGVELVLLVDGYVRTRSWAKTRVRLVTR
jgi:hypothetical protein